MPGALLGLLLAGVSLVCAIIVLIDAFRDEVWKGVVGILCGLYLLYYAVFEFEHEYKWLIVLGLFSSALAGPIMRASGAH